MTPIDVETGELPDIAIVKGAVVPSEVAAGTRPVAADGALEAALLLV
jgi:hypothetical protein